MVVTTVQNRFLILLASQGSSANLWRKKRKYSELSHTVIAAQFGVSIGALEADDSPPSIRLVEVNSFVCDYSL